MDGGHDERRPLTFCESTVLCSGVSGEAGPFCAHQSGKNDEPGLAIHFYIGFYIAFFERAEVPAEKSVKERAFPLFWIQNKKRIAITSNPPESLDAGLPLFLPLGTEGVNLRCCLSEHIIASSD